MNVLRSPIVSVAFYGKLATIWFWNINKVIKRPKSYVINWQVSVKNVGFDRFELTIFLPFLKYRCEMIIHSKLSFSTWNFSNRPQRYVKWNVQLARHLSGKGLKWRKNNWTDWWEVCGSGPKGGAVFEYLNKKGIQLLDQNFWIFGKYWKICRIHCNE